MGVAIFLFVALTLISSCHAEYEYNPIRLPGQPQVGRNPAKINCQSFRLGVEANNIQNFETVPSYCTKYLKSYYAGKQYTLDVEGVVIQAYNFAETVPLPKDLRPNVWVFDLDETLISNFDFLNSTYWGEPLNYTALYQWVASPNATAPKLPAVKFLYDAVLKLNFKTVILSESPESLSDVRIKQLKSAGYDGWEAIFFRGSDENDITSYEFKRRRVRDLVGSDKRYRIVATVGDQWSDLTIPHAGYRTFKVPNPLYYVE